MHVYTYVYLHACVHVCMITWVLSPHRRPLSQSVGLQLGNIQLQFKIHTVAATTNSCSYHKQLQLPQTVAATTNSCSYHKQLQLPQTDAAALETYLKHG